MVTTLHSLMLMIALKNARPDNVEFRLYKSVLGTKCIGLVKLFAMMRLTFKKIIGRS